MTLYSDESFTTRVADILSLNYIYSDTVTVTFTGLQPGVTYYVAECDANGNMIESLKVGNRIIYYASFDDGHAVCVNEAGGSAELSFENEFYYLPDGFYKEAELTITKKLLNAAGTALADTAVFYAGIFTDETHTTLVDMVSYNIVELNLAGSAEVSAVIYVALTSEDPVTLYIAEVDANGTPVDHADDFMYTVSIDNPKVTVSESDLSAGVTITNQEIEIAEEESGETTELETETYETETETEKSTEKSTEASSVQTGDETPIILYLYLMLAAFGMLAGGGVYRKRRRRS